MRRFPAADHDPELDLDLGPRPLGPLHGRPFTRPMAASAGICGSALERMLAHGVLRRVLRGVYVAARTPDEPSVRLAALALLVSPDTVVVDRSAAWCHGLPGRAPLRPDVLGGRGRRHFGARRTLADDEVQRLGGLQVTDPLRTCADLGRLLCPDRALPLLDAALASGTVEHRSLLASLPRHTGLPGGAALRRMVALADGRAADPAESVLRLRWLDAGLPTPVPGATVGAAGRRVRLALAVPERRFGVTFEDHLPDTAAAALRGGGWGVVRLARRRILDSDAELVQRHLFREFHGHLLRAAG